MKLITTFFSRALYALLFSSVAMPFFCFSAELRLGMIGLDTSHVTAFTKLLNDATDKEHVPGGKVVAAFKGGSPDIPSSISRVNGYTKELQEKYGVKIMNSIEDLCKEVDAVLLMSVDGRPHLAQAKPVFLSGKRLYIDKPIAGSLADAIQIYELSKKHNVPVFSSSSYRYYPGLVELKKSDLGSIRNVISYGPASLEPHHPDMFWYGVHPTEALFTILGKGCETVVRTTTENTDVITGTWREGQVGTLIGLRGGPAPNKVVVFGTKGVGEQKPGGNYAPLVREIIRFFETGISPVPLEETVELFAFMESADESKRQGGKPVLLKDVLIKNGWKQ